MISKPFMKSLTDRNKAGLYCPAFLITRPLLLLWFRHLFAPVMILKVIFVYIFIKHFFLCRLYKRIHTTLENPLLFTALV